jgi:hypothetical protein
MVLDIEKILKLNQEDLLDFSYLELLKRGYRDRNILYTNDYVYAKGNIPILLVAHYDIVHKEIPKIIVNDKRQRILWSPTGIGGDDRCGVYAILKICEKLKPYVLFTTDEEIGGVGVRKFVKEIDEIPVNFIIEIDRKGNEEVVFYQCGNKEFQNYIISFGFEKNYGSYSDVSTLSTHYDIAGCNVSAGYYNQHTTTEHIYMEHLENTMEKVMNILKDTINHKFYDCQEVKYTTPKYNYGYGWDYGYDEDWYSDWYYDYTEGRYKRKTKKNKNKKKAKEVEEKKEEKKGQKEQKDEKENIDKTYNEEEMLQKEADYYSLSPEEWKKKYKKDKPLDVIDIY